MRRKIKRAVVLIFLFLFCFSLVSQAATVIDGSGGWYFYGGDDTIPDYQGTNLYTESRLEELKENLMLTRDLLAERGIDFYVFLAPNKEHIYWEYLPESYWPPASYTRIEQVYDALKDDLCVICPVEDLLAAKYTWPDIDFYYRTDTHWNDPGAYVATKPLLHELGIDVPEFGELTITPVPYSGLDLARLSGRNLPDTALFLSGYTDRVAAAETDNATYTRYHTEWADPRKILVYGDSFGMSVAAYLAPHFENVFASYLSRNGVDLLAREEPDIVIYEVLERYLDNLFTYPPLP